ncbi:phosphotransferase [Jannaschia sp. R86511]|uniref:phosphotransferase n=1 Tax=Jannaschia sp. R86511 TaxID=3093853 RepID=UPI0036D3EFF3
MTVTAAGLAEAVAVQFPHVAVADVVAVPSAGTVIAPFRVGPTLLARVPLVPVAGPEAAAGVKAEGRYARVLSGLLPIQVPRLVGVGGPFDGYDGVWSLWTWLDGRSLDRVLDEEVAAFDVDALAVDLARVLRAQQSLPTDGASWSGTGRGGRPLADTEWVRTSIQRSAHLIDRVEATRVWENALAARAHQGPPVSINGDAVPGNFLVTDGRLSGMIDVAEPVVGDPAADLQPAWVIFEEPQRTEFRDAMGPDEAAWQRGRGWAFEMAIGGLHYYEHTNPIFFRMARRTLRRLIATS